MPPRPAAPTVVAPSPPLPSRPLGRPASRHAELEEEAETGRTRLERAERPAGRLAVLDGRGEVVRSVPLRTGRTVVGRGEADVTLDGDLTISPGHASLEARDGGVYLRDLRSRNGVYRRLRGDHMLADGDALMLGEQRFTFQASWGEDDADAEGTLTLGAPGYDAGARLLHWRRGGQLCGIYLLREGITVGRSRGDVTFPQDSGLDAEHAVFRQLGERYGLIDLGSRRGIFLRLAPGEAHRLEDGDELMLGHTRLRYLQSDEAS
jgi:pSer/pThr/pTyr-binding forkhead associated (FHA) protein